MLKSILLTSTIFGLCLTHAPQHAEACGPKTGVNRLKVPGARQARSQNPSSILIVGRKDSDLIKKLRFAKHDVDFADSVDEANSSKYDLIIVDANQLDAAKDRFAKARFVNKRSSDNATAKMAERVLAQRVAIAKPDRFPSATTEGRTLKDSGSDYIRRDPVASDSEPPTAAPPTAAPPTAAPPTAAPPTAAPPTVAPPAAKRTIKWSRQFQFATNKANLSSAAQRRIRANAKWLEQNPGTSVIIEGHTDSVGEESNNLDLSERRASMARDFLIGLGIDSSRITIVPKGELDPGFMPSTSAKNRRIVLIKQ